MSHVSPSAETAVRHRFVMRKQTAVPVQPPKVQPPIKCIDCGAVDIWCLTCQTAHPIRRIEQHVHIAHCDLDPTIRPMELRQACKLPGKAATDAAFDPLAYEHKREIAAASVGLALGFILGVGATLATLAWVFAGYRSPAPIEHATEQPIER